MNAQPTPLELPPAAPWRLTRWLLLIALVCGLQLGALFWLSDSRPLAPEPQAAAPSLRLAASSSSEWLALTDPTLFALPHRQGFSGQGWLVVKPPVFEPYQWKEEQENDSLPLRIADLGAGFQEFITANVPAQARVTAQPEPPLAWPEVFQPSLLPGASRLDLRGPLARRPLLAEMKLPSWQASEILTNSVVQVLVNRDGEPVSCTLISGSGARQADEYALKQARAARFKPLSGTDARKPGPPLAGLTLGELVFQWHTTAPLTNAP